VPSPRLQRGRGRGRRWVARAVGHQDEHGADAEGGRAVVQVEWTRHPRISPGAGVAGGLGQRVPVEFQVAVQCADWQVRHREGRTLAEHPGWLVGLARGPTGGPENAGRCRCEGGVSAGGGDEETMKRHGCVPPRPIGEGATGRTDSLG
jgi:hypothetical protein